MRKLWTHWRILIPWIVIAVEDISVTTGKFERIQKVFLISLCSLSQSRLRLPLRTTPEIISFCILRWYENFYNYYCSFLHSHVTSHTRYIFLQFLPIKHVFDPMCCYNFTSSWCPLTTLGVFPMNTWTPCNIYLLRIIWLSLYEAFSLLHKQIINQSPHTIIVLYFYTVLGTFVII